MPRSRSTALVWIGIAALTAVSVLLGLWFRQRPESRYDQQILAAAERYRIDPALIKAVIWQESRFNAHARGKAGEIGLMQVREVAAFEWADSERIHPFAHEAIIDARTNIYCGTYYLSRLLLRYQKTDNPVAYALADYNAGRTHVLRWNKGTAQTNSVEFLARMDFPGTRQYAKNILSRREYYRKEFSAKGAKGNYRASL